VTAEDIAAAVAQSNALLPSGEFIAATFDANVYTDAVPVAGQADRRRLVKLVDGRPVYIRDVADVEDGGAAPTQTVSVNGENAVYLNVLRDPGREHARDRRGGEEDGRRPREPAAMGWSSRRSSTSRRS
jgi:multidrug efflux pump subunit AcrB